MCVVRTVSSVTCCFLRAFFSKSRYTFIWSMKLRESFLVGMETTEVLLKLIRMVFDCKPSSNLCSVLLDHIPIFNILSVAFTLLCACLVLRVTQNVDQRMEKIWSSNKVGWLARHYCAKSVHPGLLRYSFVLYLMQEHCWGTYQQRFWLLPQTQAEWWHAILYLWWSACSREQSCQKLERSAQQKGLPCTQSSWHISGNDVVQLLDSRGRVALI